MKINLKQFFYKLAIYRSICIYILSQLSFCFILFYGKWKSNEESSTVLALCMFYMYMFYMYFRTFIKLFPETAFSFGVERH